MELGEFLSSLQFTVLFSVLYVFVRISNMVLDIFPVSQPGFCDVPPLPLEVHAAVGFQNAYITHFRVLARWNQLLLQLADDGRCVLVTVRNGQYQ